MSSPSPKKILLTGANGYIGKRILPILVDEGHHVYCCVRQPERLTVSEGIRKKISVLKIDFLDDRESLEFPDDIDASYYLIHSMTTSLGGFQKLEEQSAKTFLHLSQKHGVKHVIYLSGIVNSPNLSEHLKSRLAVEEILRKHNNCTVFRAGIIVGSGSASFEIIRDLVEKLPVMIAPKWLDNKIQPIAIRNVLQTLSRILDHPELQNEVYDIGGPSVLTYKEMLLQFAEIRGLKRHIYTLPVMTPKLSSYWLYFMTSTSYNLAVNLVNSMKHNVVAEENMLLQYLGIKPFKYKEAVKLAFKRIEQNSIISSWKDAVNYKGVMDINDVMEVPQYGVFKDEKKRQIRNNTREQVLENVFRIGGDRGWYYGGFLWKTRGIIDKAMGGIGLRRGRTSPVEIAPGNALDFWRVLIADKKKGRLLLYAEMKLPGEAWLEFKITKKNSDYYLTQTATFRPSGLVGRLYWMAVWPFHLFVFNGMISKIVQYKN